MSFVPNPSQQISFDDSMNHLTERELRFFNKSWGKYFGDYIFPMIDESPYAVLYSDVASRPNTPVNVQLGALILREYTGQSDDEILESLMFDVRYQYALHTTSYTEQPLSDRTLSRFRERCATYEAETGIDLIHETIIAHAKELEALMKIDPSLKRMDSMMVAANIKRMSRLELLYTVVANLIKEMKAKGDEVPESMQHYLNADDRNLVIYHNRSDQTEDKIQIILNDGQTLKTLCEPRYDESSNYQLLVRALREQAVEEDGKLRLRKKEDGGMSSDILQNPSDPEATFRCKNGEEHRGYVANIVECKGENGSIIEDYQFEPNNHSDSEFMKETIEEMGPQANPVTFVTDAAFGGEENQALAAANNITLITTNLTGRDTDEIMADFVLSEDGSRVEKCPNGQTPKSCSYNQKTGTFYLSFERCQCENCPYKDRCKPTEHKKTYRRNYSHSMRARAIQKRDRKSDNFREMSHFRNGVETVPSFMRRKYGVDHMPVRGKIRGKMFFGFKIGAANFAKFCKYMQSSGSCSLVPARS